MQVLDHLHESIQQHYATPGLGDRLLAALQRSGKNLDRLVPADLAPVDEFHVRGRAATLELARAAHIYSGMDVLDVGSGLGGSSRCLAAEFGCHVTGIDLTDEYCRVASMLTERIGMSHLVQFRQGDALDLPFPEAAFDVVWTEHASMNIPDKARLYREMARVLKPGGTLAMYDILAGTGGPVHYPAPWARSAETSFLVTAAELRRHLEGAGFVISSWTDTTPAGCAWFVELTERVRREGPPLLGFHLMLGPDFPQIAANQRRNLEEDRIVLAQVVAENAARREH